VATVRIYKVAELLNTTSQEVMALLKRDHGIDVKSASSTIEEVVARSFVERLARQRAIAVPPAAAMFSDAPAARAARKPGGGRAPEPPKQTAPPLPPPRLIKTIRPYPQPEGEAGPAAEGAPGTAAGVHEAVEPMAGPAPHTAPPALPTELEASAAPAVEPTPLPPAPEAVEAPPASVSPEPVETPAVAAEAPVAPGERATTASRRVVDRSRRTF